jgi:hypothetical protein
VVKVPRNNMAVGFLESFASCALMGVAEATRGTGTKGPKKSLRTEKGQASN